MRLPLALAVLVVASPATAAMNLDAHCEIADILFGKIKLDPVGRNESALIRSATFENPKKDYDVILGEITVDRGGFTIYNAKHVVIGQISTRLVVEGSDTACDKNSVVSIKKVQDGAYMVLSDRTPEGTIEGKMPNNPFGIR